MKVSGGKDGHLPRPLSWNGLCNLLWFVVAVAAVVNFTSTGWRFLGSSTAPFTIIIHNMRMFLQQVFVLLQQNEGFRGSATAPSTIIIHNMLMLLQRVLVLLQQNEGFQGSSTAPFTIIIHDMLMPLQHVLVLLQQNEGFQGSSTATLPSSYTTCFFLVTLISSSHFSRTKHGPLT